MSDNFHNYQLLLAEAARLYERHTVGRPEPFNVFSVLYKETNEVNLHSRFLHALLDYQSPEDETRENLKDFLLHVDVQGFELCGVEVKREWKNIDILLTNANKKALAIENKINAGDQYKQLWRYYNTLKKQNYLDRNIHLLYLTLDGREPTSDSVGDLDPEKITTVSYKDDLLPWLKHCQKRAYEEPTLRESIAQYLRLIQKLTGTNFSGAYMNDLEELCLQNNNLVLVHDLKEAMTEVHISLLQKLLGEINSALKKDLLGLLPNQGKNSVEDIKNFVTGKRGYNYYRPLSYPLGSGDSASLCIELHTYIAFGVRCHQQTHGDEHNRLKEALKDVSSGQSTVWWPWVRFTDESLNPRDLDRKTIEFLSNKSNREEYAAEIAQGLEDLLEVIEDIALINAI